jgi:CrcB protein
MTESRSLATVESTVLIALGGFAGANVRYAADLVLPAQSATLAANVVGSALLGFVLYEEALVGAFSRQLRVALGTGFLSSLTTYSTFAVQTATAAPTVAALIVVGNYALGFLGVVLGRWTALRVAAGVRA